MFDPIPQNITETTIPNALKLIKALRDFSKNHTAHNNIVHSLPVHVISEKYSISPKDFEEGSILLHNNLLVRRGSQQTGPYSSYKICELTETGRDLSEEDIEKILIQAVRQPNPAKKQSPNN